MRILIAADETGRIADVAGVVARLVQDRPAEVLVLHVLHPEEGGRSEAAQEQLAAERKAFLQEALNAADLQATILVRTRPLLYRMSEYVLNEAERLNPDMVVVASKRAGGVLDMILGGIAQELLRRSPAPVLIVRPAAQ